MNITAKHMTTHSTETTKLLGNSLRLMLHEMPEQDIKDLLTTLTQCEKILKEITLAGMSH